MFTTSVDKDHQNAIVTLKDTESGTTVQLFAFGSVLNHFSIEVDGQPFNIVDAFEDVEDAKANITNGFKSTKLSPFVCRMNKGQYQFNHQPYQVEKFFLPPHAIHGLIFDAEFAVVATTADANAASVTLAYEYQADDKGYPFYYSSVVTWILSANNKLTATTVVCNQSQHPIPFADGWHPYFTLGEKIDHCTLQFNSDTQIEFDETLIPTGQTIHDERFLHGQQLEHIFLDNCFKLQNEKKCVLENSQLKLEITADDAYPYLQIYTPPHRKSIAIENLSATPDAFNNAMGLLLLAPQQVYSFSTTYQITKK